MASTSSVTGVTPLHLAAESGDVDKVRELLQSGEYNVNCTDSNGRTPLHYVCAKGHLDMVKVLISDFNADVLFKDINGCIPLIDAALNGWEHVVLTILNEYHCPSNKTLLHWACKRGNVSLVRTLIQDHKADINAGDDENNTSLHVAALCGKKKVALFLINEVGCDINIKGYLGRSLLHSACIGGDVSLVQTLIRDHKADINARDDENNTPLHVAALCGKKEVALFLINDVGSDINIKGYLGWSLLHSACIGGNVSLVQTLIRDHKANINARDDENDTPLSVAALGGKKEVALFLINEVGCDINIKGYLGRSLLHSACIGGDVSLVQTLIRDHKADINAKDDQNNTPLHMAALDVALFLINEVGCDINVKGYLGRSLLHYACYGGDVSLVQTLIRDYKADINARDDENNTPLHVAALGGKKEVALFLINEVDCDINVKDDLGRSLLHSACNGGNVSLVQTLIRDHKADINAKDDQNNTPLHVAALDVALFLINEVGCDVNVKGYLGRSLLHYACYGGDVSLVQTLIRDNKADINARDDENNTPLHVAALGGKKEVALFLINEVDCDINVKDDLGRSLLHSACNGGNVSLVQTLIRDHKADINARDDENSTPLHVAALCGEKKVALFLINEVGCDINIKGYKGWSLLHSACKGGNVSLVQTLIRDHKADINARDDDNDTPLHVAALAGKEEIILLLVDKFTSPLVSNIYGNTPLHICSFLNHTKCVDVLLQKNAPILIRNIAGMTPEDFAKGDAKLLINEYMKQNRDKTLVDYHGMQERAKKKYSGAQHITRLFIIGNPGAGKSSLVESLKREGYFESFWRVFESTVPPHTAGIVPSIYTSKHYGRVQFYDFAGDPEYYSSHAAILENLASSSKGDNIFIIVIDLREDNLAIENMLLYWSAFIQHQKFKDKPSLIVIGSHSDLMSKENLIQRSKFFEILLKKYSVITRLGQNTVYFQLDCCKPGSKEISEVQEQLISLTGMSHSYRLSFEASILLGLLEKDFSNVTACSVSTLVSHIEDTGVHLPNKAELLHPILHELHEVGILLLIGDRTKHDYHITLKTSKLTNEVHKTLFSEDAIQQMSELASLNIGIVPEDLLQEILPPYITKECLIHLQYCQEIKQEDIGLFLSTPQHTTSSPQSFLFFPALCSADKSEVSWTTPPDSYSIGWFAQCTDPYDYFPPRFLHVLLLRIIFKFTLTAPQEEDRQFQRRCSMWTTGVHWLMEEGVECMVEMVNVNKGPGVVIITRSEPDAVENCISVFNSIVSCVMETMKEFCHSIRPQFFLLDSTQQDDYLSEDNFIMSEVEKVLISSKGEEAVISKTGKKKMKRSRLLWLHKLSHWNSIFHIDFTSVHFHLKTIVKELFDLGLQLDIPSSVLEAIEVQYPTDVDKQRRELVRKWMSSSQDLPCWWHLVEALKKIGKRAIADEIEEECGEWLNLRISCVEVYHCPTGDNIQLQKKLLDPKLQTITPDVEFLELFAGVVGSKWSSLACLLSLTSEEIEEVKTEEEDQAFLMLKKWSSKEGATYGQLCKRLKTILLFQYV